MAVYLIVVNVDRYKAMRSPQFNSRARKQVEQSAELAEGLRKMLQLAEAGHLIGGWGGMMDQSRKSHPFVLGYAAVDLPRAHYGAARLADMLLWPDDHDLPGSVSGFTE